MIRVQLIIGDYPFLVNTAAYNALKKTAAWRWKPQQRIGRAPAQQLVGRDAQTIQISGVILPVFNGGLRQVELMRLAADQGEPLTLIDGMGFLWGEWVITAINEDQSRFMADGAAREIGFSMSLTEYGGDDDRTAPLATPIAGVSAVLGAI